MDTVFESIQQLSSSDQILNNNKTCLLLSAHQNKFNTYISTRHLYFNDKTSEILKSAYSVIVPHPILNN